MTHDHLTTKISVWSHPKYWRSIEALMFPIEQSLYIRNKRHKIIYIFRGLLVEWLGCVKFAAHTYFINISNALFWRDDIRHLYDVECILTELIEYICIIISFIFGISPGHLTISNKSQLFRNLASILSRKVVYSLSENPYCKDQMHFNEI